MKQNIITFMEKISVSGYEWDLQDEISKLNADGWMVKQISSSLGSQGSWTSHGRLETYCVVSVLVEKEE